ncbi:hypothetical protein A8950_1698 [Dongia mobilis]|uniref:Uncharacterized protein n=1 Tax=Dongia mobilis TaxID=578943 RepID=A0A4R6WQ68_9PROT|nr:hypothetical protein [Dongia mobilis]TDQ83411.1 hypothetical protein A8950_1698 [Dongia mobilis]
MQRALAEQMMDALLRLGPGFNEIDALAREIEDADERGRFIRKLAEGMSVMGYELVMHIVRQYPDLDPDK